MVRGGLVLSGVAVLWIMVGSLKSYDLNYFDISSNFAKYGWCYANLYLVKFSSVEKPDHYSDKEVESILSQMDNDSERTGVVQPKNLIVIMNESFGDIGLSGGLETNQDYMPYIRGLTENTVKGNLHVNTFGGNTCISEYEFLTGNTMHFLPTGIVPYTSVCEDSEEGLVKILQAQGYYAVAMHPYGPSN